MLQAPNTPDTIQAGTTSPDVPRTGSTWDARLRGLVIALDNRVPGSADHGRRVGAFSGLIAVRLGLGPYEVARIERAGRVHDVGKIIVSPEILEKPGALTRPEFEEVQRHAAFGARLVASLDDPMVTAIVRHHHERLDGSGYPDRLRGTAIPIGARIVGVADSYDALTTRRPYRDPLTRDDAILVLNEEAGCTLDPAVVAAFTA